MEQGQTCNLLTATSAGFSQANGALPKSGMMVIIGFSVIAQHLKISQKHRNFFEIVPPVSHWKHQQPETRYRQGLQRLEQVIVNHMQSNFGHFWRYQHTKTPWPESPKRKVWAALVEGIITGKISHPANSSSTHGLE
jgi:hypothetical protein